MTTEDRIYARYVRICGQHEVEPESKLDFTMTLFFADQQHPLDFERLLKFPDFDFSHDAFGMLRHMNRETTKLENFFVPRCAKQEVAA